MTQDELIEKAKAYVQSRYNHSYGYQVWVECTDHSEWVKEVQCNPVWADLKAEIDSYAEIKTAEYGEVTAEIF